MERSVLPTRVDRKAVEPAKAAEKPPSVRQVKPLKSEAEEKKVEAKPEEKKAEKVAEKEETVAALKLTESEKEATQALVNEFESLTKETTANRVMLNSYTLLGASMLLLGLGLLAFSPYGLPPALIGLFTIGLGALAYENGRSARQKLSKARKKLRDFFGIEEEES